MLIGLYATEGKLFKAFDTLSTLKKLHAFQLSVNHSLQKSQSLLSYYDDDLPSINHINEHSIKDISHKANGAVDSTDNKSLTKEIDGDKDAFAERFISNRAIALRNNLTTIKSLFVSDNVDHEIVEESTQEITEKLTLPDGLLTDKDKIIVIELLEEIEKEVAKNRYSTKYIITKIKAISAILTL
jgi:hypothetical protein